MKIFDLLRKYKKRSARAALDSTRPNAQTQQYYAGQQSEPADIKLDRSTRLIAQTRCEEEALNDVVTFGALLKSMALTIGTGPSLDIVGQSRSVYFGNSAPIDDEKAKTDYLEERFNQFAREIHLLDTLRVIQYEELYHGEVILRKLPCPSVPGVGFTWRLIRPERLGNDFNLVGDPFVYDGIRYDRDDDSGVPIFYYIQVEKVNPQIQTLEFEAVPADEIIHVFTPILPQQHRGLPPLQSALPRIAQLKKLISASLTAAINSARLALIFSTDNQEILASLSDTNSLEIQKGFKYFQLPEGGIVAPPGYTPQTLDPKQPFAQFKEVKQIISGDIGSSLGIGSGKINNDHSGYNYSSAKMDDQIDSVMLRIRQNKISDEILNPIFDSWIEEFAERDSVAYEFLNRTGGASEIRRQWLWPEPQSIDPKTDAETLEILNRIGATTLDDYYSRKKQDSAEQLKKWGEEHKIFNEILQYTQPVTEEQSSETIQTGGIPDSPSGDSIGAETPENNI